MVFNCNRMANGVKPQGKNGRGFDLNMILDFFDYVAEANAHDNGPTPHPLDNSHLGTIQAKQV